MDPEGKPQAKDGGVFAGFATLIREIADLIAASGGVIVVIIGVLAVGGITSAALGTVAEGERATVATAAFSVLGTIVGAFFGLRVGQKGKEEAEQARHIATAKVERMAAHMDGDTAVSIMKEVEAQASPQTAPQDEGQL